LKNNFKENKVTIKVMIIVIKYKIILSLLKIYKILSSKKEKNKPAKLIGINNKKVNCFAFSSLIFNSFNESKVVALLETPGKIQMH
jgi:hypothetical protein